MNLRTPKVPQSNNLSLIKDRKGETEIRICCNHNLKRLNGWENLFKEAGHLHLECQVPFWFFCMHILMFQDFLWSYNPFYLLMGREISHTQCLPRRKCSLNCCNTFILMPIIGSCLSLRSRMHQLEFIGLDQWLSIAARRFTDMSLYGSL